MLVHSSHFCVYFCSYMLLFFMCLVVVVVTTIVVVWCGMRVYCDYVISVYYDYVISVIWLLLMCLLNI